VELLRVKAGRRAYELIQSGDFSLDCIGTYLGPAVGPRWLIASGFDLTLLKGGLLGNRYPVWLIGASAGAWRFAAWLQPDAVKSYQTLLEAYITASYGKHATPQSILLSLMDIVNSYIEDDALPFALNHKKYRLGILTCRMKGLMGCANSWLQRAGFIGCFLANALHPDLIHRMAERILFYYGPRAHDMALKSSFRGRSFPLSAANFKPAVIASGAIPVAVAGVRNIFGAPDGMYRDGGLIDYHIRENYETRNNGLTLLFHHQERIIPGWLDKRFKKRRPPEQDLESVIMVYPTEAFVASLPDGRIPDRGDFKTFLDDPATRIANWRKAAELSAPLGEAFLEMIASGRLRDTVERL